MRGISTFLAVRDARKKSERRVLGKARVLVGASFHIIFAPCSSVFVSTLAFGNALYPMAFALVESSSSSSGGGSQLPLPSSHLYDITSGDGDDADDFLEDAGFFGTADGATRPLSRSKSLLEGGGGMSASMSNESSPQKALDELFRKPTSFGSMLDDEGDGEEEPFDLDRMIEMEREEQEPPEDFVDEDEELRDEEPPEDEEDERAPRIGGTEEEEEDEGDGGVLESNGFLDPSSVKTRANDTTKSKPATPIRTMARQSVVMRGEASTSTARLARTEVVEVEDKEDEEEELERDRGPVGLNGIPKYLPVGLATATLLDGSVVRFEKRRMMKAYKVSGTHAWCASSNAQGLKSSDASRNRFIMEQGRLDFSAGQSITLSTASLPRMPRQSSIEMKTLQAARQKGRLRSRRQGWRCGKSDTGQKDSPS